MTSSSSMPCSTKCYRCPFGGLDTYTSISLWHTSVRPRVASLISKWANVVSCINVSDHVSGALIPGP